MTTAVEAPGHKAEGKRQKAGGGSRVHDPTTAYARDIDAGRIPAGRAVRLAARRHLRDLERQRTPAFPYYYDRKDSLRVIRFFPGFLTLEDGRQFILPPWLQFCYGAIFGWKRQSDGGRKYQYGYFETAKGSGKSPSAAGIGLYCMTVEDEPFGEIYSAAFDKGQASIILNDAIRMGEASEHLRYVLDIGKYNIANVENGSFFRAVSAEHRGKSGPRPSVVLGDEIHEHRDGRVINKLVAGFKGRTQPLALLFTNSGSDKTSYCWELHQKSLDVLEGRVEDEQWFAYVAHLDPCDECFAEGYQQPKDACPRCDNWTDPAVWPKVSPALGIVVQPKYQQDAIDRALSVPSEYSLVRRLNFCIWTETHQVWITSDRWDACKVPAVSTGNPDLLPCAAGLDPSSTRDLTAFVVALRRDDPPSAEPAPEVAIEGLDEQGQQVRQVYTLNFTVELVPYFWIPEDTLHERVRTERIPYDVWARKEKLFTTPGPAIDHNRIYDFVLGAWKQFRVQKLGMDENSGRFLFLMLQQQGRLGDNVVSVGQGKKLSEAFKFLEMLVAHRRLLHDGHPVLAWNIANAEPQRDDRTTALWIEKPSETKRIDGAVAAAMAIKELMALPAKRKKPVGVRFWGGGS